MSADGNVLPPGYFLSEVHDPRYADQRQIEKMVSEGGVIARYETQKDGAIWLKVYKERRCTSAGLLDM